MNGLRSSYEDRPFMVRRGRLGKLITNGFTVLPPFTQTDQLLLIYLTKKLFLESL